MRKLLSVLVAILAFLLLPSAALAQSTIVVVRHAERADAGMAAVAGADPDLSDVGRARRAFCARWGGDGKAGGGQLTLLGSQGRE